MTSTLPQPSSLLSNQPDPDLAGQLAPDEQIVATLETDLDTHLAFAAGRVVLTDRRVLARSPGSTDWTAWPLEPGLFMLHHDHAGVGTLELHDARARLAVWRFTLGRNVAAVRLQDRFTEQQATRQTGTSTAPQEEVACPTCGAPLEPDQEECPVCSRELHEAPSTWTLFRLWRFARPYRNPLLAGFLLTLASTGATLVPPYLTIPLMDKVLIPYEQGHPIDTGLVALLLAGLLASALVAWGLGWARTYILALVSERIGADLRTTTYEHLLKLYSNISAASAPAT